MKKLKYNYSRPFVIKLKKIEQIEHLRLVKI